MGLIARLLLVAALFAANAVRAEETMSQFAAARLVVLFPGAGKLGPATGQPPAAPVYRAGTLAGYIFSTHAVSGSTGYSGKPIDIVVGLDLGGRITGAVLRTHQEPILVIGVLERDLLAFVERFRNHDIRDAVRVGGRTRKGQKGIDAISGATVSSAVISDTILRSARKVARSRGVLKTGGGGLRLDIDRFEALDWPALLERRLVARLVLDNRQVDRALENDRGVPASGRDPNARFITLYAGLATPALVGRNLLGQRLYNQLMAPRRLGAQIVFIAASGLYSFKGTAWRRRGRFERVRIVQDGRAIALTRAQHHLIEKLAAAKAPELREMAYFVLPPEARLDPAKPWQIELTVRRAAGAGGTAVARFTLDYSVPKTLISGTAAPPAGVRDDVLWQQIWRDRTVSIAILLAALAVLTGILFFHEPIVRRPRLFQATRIGFLLFTLIWLGWWAGAQLSVINVLTFTQSLLTGFKWELFLLEPLIFILWGYVAAAMLFWGRGVFCGWLCPFGALQELTNRAARMLKVPQLEIPWGLHERLWPIKYIVFMGLFALSLGSMAQAIAVAEIEPFKTAIVLHFWRAWPYVLFAALLIAAGLFIERFFCRYLCPLGGALAMPARARMFEWLVRRPECGRPCQTCAVSCTVQAIHPEGRINPNECIHCLHCQVIYNDDHLCPPLIERRKRLERRMSVSGLGASK
ncbi:MAG TPA: 4Fe-4S binding protein [Alphaproteobacteria bacterium]|nr:4Fe-4S binding protein [Alphaproteobacteria bacterium]